MRYSITMYFACICMFVTASQVPAATDLQQQLQTARILLDQPAPDVQMLTELSSRLKTSVLNGEDARLQDSTCHTIALIERAISHDPAGHEWAVKLCTSDPGAPWMKYALEFAWPLYGSPGEKLAVADALLDKADLYPGEPWASEFKAALFRAYAAEELWYPASFLGIQLLQRKFALNPEDQLTLANTLLRANREEAAREVLFKLSKNAAPNTPQALRASVELGLIEQVLHRDIQAKNEFEAAWTVWQKQRKKPGFNDPAVVNAAARARWELLQFEFAALEKTLQVSLEWQAKEATRWCKELEKSTQELLVLSPAYDAAVAVLIGRVHRMEGDALLRLGMYSSRPEDLALRERFLMQALAAYDRAADVFILTAEREHVSIPPLKDGHWSALHTNFPNEATQRAYELYAHTANQLQTWASASWEKTPLRSFGQNGYTPRFDAIVHEAFPVLETGANYRKLAWRYARQHRDVRDADLSVASLYQDMLTPVVELRKLCGSQWQSVSSVSTQISRTLNATSNPDAVASMSENLGLQVVEAKKLADESTAALDKLFEQLLSSVPDRDSLAVLAEHKLALHREYAEMNRTLHESLDLATHNLDRRDPDAASLRSQLYKLSSQAADIEMATLEAGHMWAEANNFLSQGGKDLYARLSERDPSRYPLSGGVLQAGR